MIRRIIIPNCVFCQIRSKAFALCSLIGKTDTGQNLEQSRYKTLSKAQATRERHKKTPEKGSAGHGSAGEVFAETLRLGLTSFGGPVAHLGYFERSFVREKKWLSPEDFAGLVGLCQLLPGPTSSQVSFLTGLQRAGAAGALAAFIGFTLPSALLMLGFGLIEKRLGTSNHGGAFADSVHGLKLAAVAVVAQAAFGMARRHCPDGARGGLALGAMALALTAGGTLAQMAALALGALGGWLWCGGASDDVQGKVSEPKAGLALPALAAFAVLLAGLPLLAHFVPYCDLYSPAPASLHRLLDIFYRSGALVFGGGHVVLPLLRDSLVPSGFITDVSFLDGYAFAQALPGPLFSFAAYLGAQIAPAGFEMPWAAASVIFIFLPGLLLALAGRSLWQKLQRAPGARAALLGLNAAVTGLLGAALYNPVWTGAVHDGADVVIAAAALFLLERKIAPPLAVVALSAMTAALWRAAISMLAAG
jgi:chromate transporter